MPKVFINGKEHDLGDQNMVTAESIIWKANPYCAPENIDLWAVKAQFPDGRSTYVPREHALIIEEGTKFAVFPAEDTEGLAKPGIE